MFELIAIGGFWWWTIIAILAVVLVFCVEVRNPVGATVALLIAFLIAQFLTPLNPVGWVWANPLYALGILVGWFALGGIWTIFRWKLYVRENRTKIQEAYARYSAGRKNPNVAATGVLQTNDVSAFKRSSDNPIRVDNHKALLVLWLNYWPVSAFWWAFHAPIKYGFKFVYANIVRILHKISDNEIDRALH